MQTPQEIAGPLWISKLFDNEFVNCMLNEYFTHLKNVMPH